MEVAKSTGAPVMMAAREFSGRSGRYKYHRALKLHLCRKSHSCCYRCRWDFDFTTFTVDHVVPLAAGGSDREENMQLLCRGCNTWKTGIDLKFISEARRRNDINDGMILIDPAILTQKYLEMFAAVDSSVEVRCAPENWRLRRGWDD